ncbi:spondin domain-containing protein [Alteromonas gilva]|uniref:Spondin domain-containing protein n=1 Tax=Alteromonas gilva TaxID=2987522 RepID=A0ABT5KZJ9_9ALTE|nr:spondin domain-containing protein [Alteromonas gilva]MDC8830053.1 spondin domain-containing protein [Alteromonas gilva]
MKIKQLTSVLLAAGVTAIAPALHAAELEVSVQNLTRGIYFTPILIAAHTPGQQLFNVGEAASAELQEMAEGGNITGLAEATEAMGADNVINPAGGLLMPTATTSTTLSTADTNTALSIVAMMLPTNDGFIGLNSWEIPTEAGTYTIYINAYDAGTEANDEIRGGGAPGVPGLPVPPPLEDLVGTGGSGVTAEITNDTVHIHPGNLGDDDAEGGMSDVSNTVQRWLNPVARVTVTVSE